MTRTVGANTPMVTFERGQYSDPHRLAGQTVWVRRDGEHVVIVRVGASGPVEVARHQITTPAARGSMTRTSRPPRPGRSSVSCDRRPPPRRRSLPSVTAQRCG